MISQIRLNSYEQKMIKKAFLETFEEGDIYLFGSRVDPTQKGGDIDLYLVPNTKFEDERERKIKFLIKLNPLNKVIHMALFRKLVHFKI